MHPYIAQTLEAIEQAVAELGPENLSRGPEGKWTAAQVLEHLDLTFAGTAKGLQRVLGSGRPALTTATLPQRVGQLVILTLGHFPAGRKSPERVLPRGAPPETVLPLIREHLAAMDRVISECEQRFGARRKFANHPILGAFSVRDWRRFHLVHTRHHMKQLAAIAHALRASAAAG